jgi:hypothetical protein
MRFSFAILLLFPTLCYGQIYVADSFTRASTIDLATHVPSEIGTSWTEVVDTCTGNYNADTADFARPAADYANCILMYAASPNPTSPNYSVKVDFIDGAQVAATDCMGVFARYTDSSNYYTLGVCDDSGLNYRMYKRVATTSTNLVTNAGGLGNNQTDTVIFLVTNQNKVAYENGTQIISNSDNALTSTGSAGVWCGQAQVANDDCDTTGHRFDNFCTYLTQVASNFPDFATNAYASDFVHTGRWYLSPVVHDRESRIAKVALIDKRCAANATIGDYDVPGELSLVYMDCPEYSKIESDQSIKFVWEGDINKRVGGRTGVDVLMRLGRPISKTFNPKEIIVYRQR